MTSSHSNTPEQWLDVPNYEGYYSVSSHGRIRRNVTRGGNHISKIVKGSVFRRTGYPMVTLCKDRTQQKRSIHSLVMEAFVGTRPDGHDVNHKDHDKTNNRLTNLEYITRAGNVRHGSGAKLTAELVKEMRRRHTGQRGSLTALAREYKIDKSHCCAILKGKWWKTSD